MLRRQNNSITHNNFVQYITIFQGVSAIHKYPWPALAPDSLVSGIIRGQLRVCQNYIQILAGANNILLRHVILLMGLKLVVIFFYLWVSQPVQILRGGSLHWVRITGALQHSLLQTNSAFFLNNYYFILLY